MYFSMDFRTTRCVWCAMRGGPIQDCSACPKYGKYGLRIEQELTMASFCTICIHRENSDLQVYCRTNRFFQEDSGEDFECYRFCMQTVHKER